ncbi:MAG: ABC-F family ATP-binding cassette domain-containing protein, partial [Bdellovibrionales bacterium]|nr:ABC-F family ATP-binding cassette domain-containing protein [Bdellovibrionales bacterium]
MSPILSANKINKTMGSKTLFEELSFGVHQKERRALIGPNGAGKSTLLKILAGIEKPDAGERSISKSIKLHYVPQMDSFDTHQSLINLAKSTLKAHFSDDVETEVQAVKVLSMAGFEDLSKSLGEHSGGWRKRFSLALAFAVSADVLLLDEPTNHLDCDGLIWLEASLKNFDGSFLLVSHDREFIGNTCNQTMEINALYEKGYLLFEGDYLSFLEQKEKYIEEQENFQKVLSNKAKREIDWLRAGVKARTTKSRSRMREAYSLLNNLDSVKARNRAGHAKVRLEIEATGRLSKKLFDIKNLNISFGPSTLIKNLSLTLGPKTHLGVLGGNGAGKTSFLKVLTRDLRPSSGSIDFAEKLKT